MQKEVPLFFRGRMCGAVICKEEMGRFSFYAERPAAISGIMRAYAGASSRPEAVILIGVMEPEPDGYLRARRTYTRDALRRTGIAFSEIDRGEIILNRSFEVGEFHEKWFECKKPEALFRDVAMINALGKRMDLLLDHPDTPHLVAAPLDFGTEFALAPAFAVTRSVHIHGKPYGVVAISKDKYPIRKK